jgi:hypothetical protein
MNRFRLTLYALSFTSLVVAILVMRLVLPACDVRPPALGFFTGMCPQPLDSSQIKISIALADRRSLEAQIADLQRQLARRRCTVASSTYGIKAPPAIDPDAWGDKDVSLLDGCWELDSDLRFIDKNTQKMVAADAWTMCFDAAGNGSQTLSLDGAITCTSDEVSAAFDAVGNLIIRDNANVQCSNNIYIYERVITCSLAGDGAAACESLQPETGARFRLSLRR